MTTYNIADNREHFNFLGRSDIADGKFIMDMTDAGIEFCADLEGDITFTYDSTEYGTRKIGLVLDNNYKNIYSMVLSPEAGSATFRLCIIKGVHNIKLYKLSEYKQGGLVLNDISFDGTFCETPEKNQLKFEFYGDSLTCGYGNLSLDRTSPDHRTNLQNGLLTYCALIARKYNAQIAVAAASGFGLTISCGGSYDDIYTAFTEYLSPERNIKWNFDNYKADVVFINLGTNDSEYCRNNPEASIPYDELHKAITDMVGIIRKHNPDCKLVFVSGVSGNMQIGEQIAVEPVYAAVAKETDNAYFINGMYNGQLGGDWHPNIEDHELVADKLSAELEKLMPDIFKANQSK